MREALELELAVLYLPRAGPPPNLQRYVTSAAGTASVRARDQVSFDDEAWRLAVASGVPLVFREEAAGWWRIRSSPQPTRGWCSHSSRAEVDRGNDRRSRATDVARPSAATLLSLLGDLLAAGISTAHLRQELQGRAIERERLRLAAEIHDGLAQDLALAMRELSLLESRPAAELAGRSAERLREAVASAHRVVRARLEDLWCPSRSAGSRPRSRRSASAAAVSFRSTSDLRAGRRRLAGDHGRRRPRAHGSAHQRRAARAARRIAVRLRLEDDR